MKSPDVLLILVDALPYNVVENMPILKDWDFVAPLRPGYGFSVNLDAELFAGLTPDEAGYFNEWTYNPACSPFPNLGWVGSGLDMLGSVYPFDRVLHRALAKLWRKPLGNIPFKQLHLFTPFTGQIWDADFPIHSLFKEFPHLEIVAAHLEPEPKPGLGGRDLAAVQTVLQKLRDGHSVFLYLVDLDHVSHEHGMFTPAYNSMLAMLRDWIDEMVQTFLSVHPHGDIFLMSDHGMANVHNVQTVCLEEVVGDSSPETYVYFLDSVMLRVWSDKPELRTLISHYLTGLDCGVLLDEEARAIGGLQDKRWGDLIFILNEGIVFNPTTYGRGVPKAMHGYQPQNDSQVAVLAYKGQNLPDLLQSMPSQDIRTRDVYAMIKHIIMTQAGQKND